MTATRTCIGLIGLLVLSAAAPEPVIRQVDHEIAPGPGGDRLAFISNRGAGTRLSLHVMNVDGSGIRRLTSGEQSDDNPNWSPDGRSIAFVSGNDDRTDIHVIAADGSGRRQLTQTGREIHPGWSPDGRRLIFTSLRNSRSAERPHLDLYTLNLEDGTERRLTSGPITSYGSWSPDGRQLVFWRLFDDNADIAVADAEGGGVRRLTTDAAFDGWPSWSPDSRHIAFARERGDEADIYVVDLQGMETLIVGGPGRKTGPRWSADGSSLYYSRRHDRQVSIWRVPWAEASRPSGLQARP